MTRCNQCIMGLIATGLIVVTVSAAHAPAAGANNQRAHDHEIHVPQPVHQSQLDPALAAAILEQVQIVKGNNQDPSAWVELGKLYHAHTLVSLALPCFERAAELDAVGAKALYFAGLAHYELGNVDEAVQALQAAAHSRMAIAAVHWRRALWQLELGEIAAAQRSIAQALDAEPANTNARIIKARLAMQAGEFAGAVSALEAVVALDPQHRYARYLLSRAYSTAGDHDNAKRERSFGASEPTWRDAWEDEIFDTRTGLKADIIEAERHLFDPDVARVVRAFEELLQRAPDNVDLMWKMSIAYQRANRIDDAIETLRKAIDINPAYDVLHLYAAGAFLNKASQAQSSRSKREKLIQLAHTHAKRTIELNPVNADGYGILAEVLTAVGRRRDALHAYTRAEVLAPKNHLWPYRIALLSVQLGDLDEAAGAIARAIHINPENTATLHLQRSINAALRSNLGPVRVPQDPRQ